MKLASFNQNSKIPGVNLLFENDGFIIEGIGNVDVEKIFALDDNNALDWGPGLQEKIYGFYNRDLPTISPFPADGNPSSSTTTVLPIPLSNRKKTIRIVLAALLALLLAGGAFAAYGFFTKKPVPVVPPAPSAIPTSTVPATPAVPTTPTIIPTETVIPQPIVYVFSEKKAISVVNAYYKALAKKDYTAAYKLTTIASVPTTSSVVTNMSAETTPQTNPVSMTNWTKYNKGIVYIAKISAGTVPVDSKIFKAAPSVETSSGRETTLQNLVNVKLSSNLATTIKNNIILYWDKFSNKYYLIDNNAIIKLVSYNKTYKKTTDGKLVTIKVTSIYMARKSLYARWNYTDNGSTTTSITVNPAATKIASKSPSVKLLTSTTFWNGLANWKTKQTITDNLFTLKNGSFFSITEKIDITVTPNVLKNKKLIVPGIPLRF